MHSPETLAFDLGFLRIWHVDPCRGPGGDDTCGWFMRAHHGDQKVLKKIVSDFEFDWDKTFDSSKQDDGEDEQPGNVYFRGLFKPNGDPRFSVSGIALNLFWLAAIQHFRATGGRNWRRKLDRFMRHNLFDILHFAENPVDSLYDGFARTFEKGCGEEYGIAARTERIERTASCIYAWIIRAERPWYRHPKWHFHHWKIQVPFLQRLKRFMTVHCKKCGQRIGISDHNCVSDGWSDNSPITCGKCSSAQVSKM